ncbi:hypothetical protein [Pseudofrankia sp. DC12]|uniref:hypothetical protein n=1 Tax=Pseudofrankia sp. DC12 TaxID=683315 RepID=UPI0005F82D58|nr:hypothetical protein [Pseudofrankia sp. DC12]
MPTRIPLSHDGLPADVTDRFAWHHRPDAPTTGPGTGLPDGVTGTAGRPVRVPLAALAGFALTGVLIVVAVVLFARNPALSTTAPVASESAQTGAATPASMVAARAVTPSPTATTTAAAASSQSPAATTRIRLPGAGPKSTATTGTGRDDTDAAASACRSSPIAQYLVRHGMPLPC